MAKSGKRKAPAKAKAAPTATKEAPAPTEALPPTVQVKQNVTSTVPAFSVDFSAIEAAVNAAFAIEIQQALAADAALDAIEIEQIRLEAVANIAAALAADALADAALLDGLRADLAFQTARVLELEAEKAAMASEIVTLGALLAECKADLEECEGESDLPPPPPGTIAHGQDVTAAKVGRLGGASQPNFGTLSTVTGTVTLSASQTIRNRRYTGEVRITGGDIVFEYCEFAHQPLTARAAVLQYNAGNPCGNATFNYCDFDSGLRGNAGTFESAGFQAGQRGTGNPGTINRASSFKLFRCRIEGYGNYLCSHKFQNNLCEVIECLMQNATTGSGTHADGMEIYSSDNLNVTRSRITLPHNDCQSCLNITPMDINMPNPGDPIVIRDCYINGGISPVLTRPTSATQNTQRPRNVRYYGNRFGDEAQYERECDFNSMNVTFDEAYALNGANQPVILWMPSNVWAPNGEGVSAHTPGAFIDESNFFGGEVWIWNGQVVGPTTEPPPPPPEPTGTWPDATNTGYRNAPGYPGSLTPFSGSLTNGATYSFRSFIGGIDLGARETPKQNLTFIGCLFKGSGDVLVRLYGSGHTFRYCSFEPNVSAPPVSYSQGYQFALCGNGGWYTNIGKFTVENCDIWGFGNAIDCQGSTQTNPHVFRGNWIHDARDGGGIDHTDGLGNYSGGGASHYVVIDNNVIESVGNTNGIGFQGGTYSNFTITNNLIGGWGYSISLFTATSAMKFENNVFSTRLKNDWGPLRGDSTAFWKTLGSTWKNNKWMVPDGAAWGVKAHDGWFWKPVTETHSGSDDTKYVSQNDT